MRVFLEHSGFDVFQEGQGGIGEGDMAIDPRNGRLRMSEPRALVEHFFRHEFGRLCAVLTRSLGVRRLDLVEDVVQAALVQALETSSRRGVPEDPAGCGRVAATGTRP